MSLASVLVISAKVRSLALKVLASACAAALRLSPSRSCSRFSVGSIASSLAADLEAQRWRWSGRTAGSRRNSRSATSRGTAARCDPRADTACPCAVLDPRPVMGEFRRLHRALDHGVVDPVELEREEQQMHRGRREALGHVAVEFRDRGIDAVAGMDEPGIGAEPAGEIVDRLIAPDRFGEPLPPSSFAVPVPRACPCSRSRRRRIGIERVEVARDFRRVDPGIEIGQIPFRQACRLARRLGGLWPWRQIS